MQVHPDFTRLRCLVLTIGVVAVVAGCGGGGGATPSIKASGSAVRPPGTSPTGFSPEPLPSEVVALDPSPTSAFAPVARLKGSNSRDTARFRLTAGTYRVAWTITATGVRGCNQIAVLRTPDGKVSSEVATKTTTVRGSQRGEDHITVVRSGTYYVSIASTCRWAISILPE